MQEHDKIKKAPYVFGLCKLAYCLKTRQPSEALLKFCVSKFRGM